MPKAGKVIVVGYWTVVVVVLALVVAIRVYKSTQ